MKKLLLVVSLAFMFSGCETTPRNGVVVKKSVVNGEFVYQPYNENLYARAPAVQKASAPIVAMSPIESPEAQSQATYSPSQVAAATSPVVREMAPIATPAPECWTISPSQKQISVAFDQWAKIKGDDWKVLWEHKLEYDIEAGGTFCSSFEAAIETVLNTYAGTNNPPKAKFYSNHVVRVISGAK